MSRLFPGAWRWARGGLGRCVVGGSAAAEEPAAGGGRQKGPGSPGGWSSDHLGSRPISTSCGAAGAVGGSVPTLCDLAGLCLKVEGLI